MIAALGARVHLFVRPSYSGAFVELFRDVLRCDVRELDFGMAYPIVLVSFPDGSAFSVEFTEAATCGTAITDDADAPRGAWIEFRAEDAEAVRVRLREAAVRSFAHAGSAHEYFAAPGGQVFRVLDLDYRGP